MFSTYFIAKAVIVYNAYVDIFPIMWEIKILFFLIIMFLNFMPALLKTMQLIKFSLGNKRGGMKLIMNTILMNVFGRNYWLIVHQKAKNSFICKAIRENWEYCDMFSGKILTGRNYNGVHFNKDSQQYIELVTTTSILNILNKKWNEERNILKRMEFFGDNGLKFIKMISALKKYKNGDGRIMDKQLVNMLKNLDKNLVSYETFHINKAKEKMKRILKDLRNKGDIDYLMKVSNSKFSGLSEDNEIEIKNFILRNVDLPEYIPGEKYGKTPDRIKKWLLDLSIFLKGNKKDFWVYACNPNFLDEIKCLGKSLESENSKSELNLGQSIIESLDDKWSEKPMSEVTFKALTLICKLGVIIESRLGQMERVRFRDMTRKMEIKRCRVDDFKFNQKIREGEIEIGFNSKTEKFSYSLTNCGVEICRNIFSKNNDFAFLHTLKTLTKIKIGILGLGDKSALTIGDIERDKGMLYLHSVTSKEFISIMENSECYSSDIANLEGEYTIAGFSPLNLGLETETKLKTISKITWGKEGITYLNYAMNKRHAVRKPEGLRNIRWKKYLCDINSIISRRDDCDSDYKYIKMSSNVGISNLLSELDKTEWDLSNLGPEYTGVNENEIRCFEFQKEISDEERSEKEEKDKLFSKEIAEDEAVLKETVEEIEGLNDKLTHIKKQEEEIELEQRDSKAKLRMIDEVSMNYIMARKEYLEEIGHPQLKQTKYDSYEAVLSKELKIKKKSETNSANKKALEEIRLIKEWVASLKYKTTVKKDAELVEANKIKNKINEIDDIKDKYFENLYELKRKNKNIPIDIEKKKKKKKKIFSEPKSRLPTFRLDLKNKYSLFDKFTDNEINTVLHCTQSLFCVLAQKNEGKNKSKSRREEESKDKKNKKNIKEEGLNDPKKELKNQRRVEEDLKMGKKKKKKINKVNPIKRIIIKKNISGLINNKCVFNKECEKVRNYEINKTYLLSLEQAWVECVSLRKTLKIAVEGCGFEGIKCMDFNNRIKKIFKSSHITNKCCKTLTEILLRVAGIKSKRFLDKKKYENLYNDNSIDRMNLTFQGYTTKKKDGVIDSVIENLRKNLIINREKQSCL